MIFKKKAIAQRIVLVLFFASSIALDKKCKKPVLVLSSRILTTALLPKQFRTMQDKIEPEKRSHISLTGLNNIQASGSGEIAPKNISHVIAQLRKKTNKQITIVDLRLESHNWINGLPYYWLSSPDELFTFRVDCYNQAKTTAQIEKDELKRSAKLMRFRQATVYEFSQGEYPFIPTALAKKIAIEDSVLTEKDLVCFAGLDYLRLPIGDDMAPSWHVIDRLVNYYRLHPNNWFHVHCNEGRGRTTTILSMIDMLYNAKKVDFNSIIERQKLLSKGGVDLFDFDSSGARVHNEFVYRLALLKNFYRYCSQNSDNYSTPFSCWAVQNGLHEKK